MSIPVNCWKSSLNNENKDVNISAVGKWTKVGVAAKTVKGNMYISVVVQVNPHVNSHISQNFHFFFV